MYSIVQTFTNSALSIPDITTPKGTKQILSDVVESCKDGKILGNVRTGGGCLKIRNILRTSYMYGPSASSITLKTRMPQNLPVSWCCDLMPEVATLIFAAHNTHFKLIKALNNNSCLSLQLLYLLIITF